MTTTVQTTMPAGAPAGQAPNLALEQEMALAISKAYGVQLKSDDERNHRIFASLRALAAHVEKHRTR
jgi:hypothetical protein